MPLFTRTFQIIAGVLAVPVIGIAIIGANYQSPFLHHLVDIVTGNTTATVASLNAPNWSIGTPLAQVQGVSVSTSTPGTVASSTSFAFAVAALDGTGTTTITGAAVVASTDANGLPNQALKIKWGAVPGATGYAVYFATTSSATATLDQYFFATSTNGAPNTQYTFASSSGSLAGTYTSTDSSAFSVKINPLGTSYLNGGKIGVATTSPITTLDIASGTIRSYSISTSTCAASNDGAIFYNAQDKHLYVCESTTWQLIK